MTMAPFRLFFLLPLLSLLLSAPSPPAAAASPASAHHGGIGGRELLDQQRNFGAWFDADEAALSAPLFSGAGQRLADKVAWQQEQVQQRLRKLKKNIANPGSSSSPNKQDTTTTTTATDGEIVTPTAVTETSPDCPYTTAGAGRANLHKCAMGYAATSSVTGGAAKTCGGKYPTGYVVTTEEDVSIGWTEGSLRWAMKYCTAGVYITFSKSMKITLVQALYINSDTTIDGRGHQIVITGGPLIVYGVSNVIMHNLEVGDIPGDTDIMHIRNTTRVWVDHLKVYNADRGTISVVYGATDVTVSNSYLHNPNFMQLLGAADDAYYDRNLRVTLYRNWYDRSHQRQPHCRWGSCHVANSLFTAWTYYCLGARVYGRIRSERNYFIASTKKEATPWFNGALYYPNFDNTGTIRSYGDRLVNGSVIHEFFGSMPVFNPPYKLALMEPTDDMRDFVMQNVGPHFPASEALP
ncbi:hypothetical protein CLOP_g10336 [Closterium sp. NIES-67]|nr:hypothetical protein CLOP_g10336 [Closterium sp. NIES-67]